MSTTQENKPVVSETKSEQPQTTVPAATTENKTENKVETKTENKATGLAKYKKFFYLFFTSSAGLLISYFAYKRFQKKH